MLQKKLPISKTINQSTDYTGRKGKGGFYRMNKSGEGNARKFLEALNYNLENGEYSKVKKIDLGIDTVDLKNLID